MRKSTIYVFVLRIPLLVGFKGHQKESHHVGGSQKRHTHIYNMNQPCFPILDSYASSLGPRLNCGMAQKGALLSARVLAGVRFDFPNQTEPEALNIYARFVRLEIAY